MRLEQLVLRNFRNYVDETLSFSHGLNVLHGPNASGKSNILEAIHLLAKSKCIRTSNIREAVLWGTDGFFVRGNFAAAVGPKEISVKYTNASKKIVKINGKEVEKLSEQVTQVPLVIFTPDDLMLCKGEPGERRRFLNGILVQTESNYLNNLLQYNKVLLERNQALKQIKTGMLPREGLDPWTKVLIDSGVMLIESRNKCVDALNRLLAEVARMLHNEDFLVELAYKSFAPKESSNEYLREAFKKILGEKYSAECALCQTLAGPHRDELDISLDGKLLRLYGSQGQQRKTVLSLKIAAVLYLKEHFNEWPITLFDDVLSELDETNQKALEDVLISLSSGAASDEASTWQCFITTAEKLNRWDKKNITVLNIERGKARGKS